MTYQPRIAILVADGFQEEECLVPRYALQLLGAKVDMVSITKKPVEIYSYFSKVGTYDITHAITEISAKDYDGILIPGGAKSPAILSQDERIKSFVREIAEQNKMVASICRGALLVASSGIAQGRHITGYIVTEEEKSDPQFRDLAVEPVVRNAGGIWEDKRVVVDKNFVSSRHPRDMRYFVEGFVRFLWKGDIKHPFDENFVSI